LVLEFFLLRPNSKLIAAYDVLLTVNRTIVSIASAVL